jgi:hypothetical protein
MKKKQIIVMVRQEMDKMVERRELPCVRRSRMLYRTQVVRSTMPMPIGREKSWRSKEGANKDRQDFFFLKPKPEFEINPVGLQTTQ